MAIKIPKKNVPRVPTKDELYHLAFIYISLSLLSLILWSGAEILNRVLFESTLDIDGYLRPILLVGFVFFLGMGYNFYDKARTTLFVKPEKGKVEDVVWIKKEFTKEQLIDEAFRKLERPGDKKNPPSPPNVENNNT